MTDTGETVKIRKLNIWKKINGSEKKLCIEKLVCNGNKRENGICWIACLKGWCNKHIFNKKKNDIFFLSQAISFDVVFNYSRLGYSRNFVWIYFEKRNIEKCEL